MTDRVRAQVVAAEQLLHCRRGATTTEVNAAYRRALHRARPDLGRVDGDWVVRVQSARDLLLAAAPPDRRRRARREQGPPSSYLPLRSSSWGLGRQSGPALDLRG